MSNLVGAAGLSSARHWMSRNTDARTRRLLLILLDTAPGLSFFHHLFEVILQPEFEGLYFRRQPRGMPGAPMCRAIHWVCRSERG